MADQNGFRPPRNICRCNSCSYNLEFNALNIPIIGEAGNNAQKVIEKMGKHLYDKHREVFAQGLALVGDFQSFLIASQFTCTDMRMLARIEFVRAGMQVLTRKNVIGDRAIEEAVIALDSKNQPTANTVIALLKEFRDVLSEQGKHAPQVPDQYKSMIPA